MSSRATSRAAASPEVVARTVTEVFAPVPLVAAMQLLAGWTGARHRPSGLLFGAAAILITIAPPYAYVLYGVHRGRLTDRHLGDRLAQVIAGTAFGAAIALVALPPLAGW